FLRGNHSRSLGWRPPTCCRGAANAHGRCVRILQAAVIHGDKGFAGWNRGLVAPVVTDFDRDWIIPAVSRVESYLAAWQGLAFEQDFARDRPTCSATKWSDREEDQETTTTYTETQVAGRGKRCHVKSPSQLCKRGRQPW